MKFEIKKVFIIGAGNVGTHLAQSLSKIVNVVGVYSKNQHSARILSQKLSIPFCADLESIPQCDLVLICVNDASIQEVISEVSGRFNCAYTSGSVALEDLSSNSKLGVFYPLQTFSKGREVDLETVPFFIESDDDELENTLFILAEKLSKHVTIATSKDRKNLHIGAVFVNNFTNHLGFLAKEIVESKGLNWDFLKPLLLETVHKMVELSPYEAQTGPARRNDTKIIDQHLSELKSRQKQIYQIITESIIETYSSKNDKL